MNELYDRNFAVAVAAQTCFVLANAMMAHYARYVAFLGGDVQQIGWITGTGVVAGLILRPWLGPLIDRLGARTTWAIGYLVYVVAALGNLLLTGLGPAIYVLRTMTEIGTALSFASGLTYVTQTAPPERRTEAIGTLGAGGFLGMLLGSYVGDFLLGGETQTHASFSWMFLVISLSVSVGAGLVLMLHRPPAKTSAGPVHVLEFLSTVRKYWPGTILSVNLMFGICMTVPFVFLARYVDVLGVPGIGKFFLVYAGSGLSLRLGLRQLPDRIGSTRVLLLGLTCMAAGMCVFPLATAERYWPILLSAFITGTAHSFIYHPMIGLSLDPFPDEFRGAGSVLALIAMDLGRLLGGPLLGNIAYYFGYGWMFVFVAAMTLTVATLFYASRRCHRVTEQQPEAQVWNDPLPCSRS